MLVGYFLALLVGLSLGVFGAGGSILTVPILVYVIGIVPVQATAYSLVVVGLTSVVGAAAYIRRGEVNVITAGIFAVPSVAAVYLTRRFLVPAIPAEITKIGPLVLGRDLIVMLLFGALMAWAAVGMIRNAGIHSRPAREESEAPGRGGVPLIAAEGMGVGVLTGLVGAGGGFLIVPVLVLAAGMAMRQAVGTSLIIITLKSLIGFLGDLGAGRSIDWGFLLLFSALAVVGILLGSGIASRVPGERVKPWFGWFVLIAGVLVIGTELFQGGGA
jgi:hypothetical protein